MASVPGYAGPMGRSMIFNQPQAPQGLLGFSGDPKKKRAQTLGDALAAFGIGLMGNGPSSTPQSPLQGFSMGLQGANQSLGQSRQEDMQDQRLGMQQQQFGMEQQKFQADQKRQADQDAFTKARQAEMERLIVGLPDDQQKAARADPDTFFKAYAEAMFPKAEGPQSALGKLGADLKAGRISQAEYNAAAAKENYIAPHDGPQDPETIRLLQAAGIDPKSPEGQSIIRSKLAGSNGISIDKDGNIQIGGPAGKPATEPQMAAGARAQLIQSGLKGLEGLYDNPDIDAWRMAGADTLAESGGALGAVAANKMKTDAEQQWAANKASALEGLAASVTGAGVAKDQFVRYTQMLPDISDKPETRKVKLKAANDYLKVLLNNAGPAGQAVLANMQEAPAPAAPAAPTAEPTLTPNLPTGGDWQ